MTFEGLGGGVTYGGNVQVTAYGKGSETAKVDWWNAGGTSFVVYVRCFDHKGDPADTRYTVLVNWPVK